MLLAQLLSFDNHPFSWGGTPLLRTSIAYPPFPIPYSLSFHTLAHSFACTKNSTLLFSSDSALFAQNNRGGGGCCSRALRPPRSGRGALRRGGRLVNQPPFLSAHSASTGAPQVLEWPHSCQCWPACRIHARLDNNAPGPPNNFQEFSRESCSGLFGGPLPVRLLLSARCLCPDVH